MWCVSGLDIWEAEREGHKTIGQKRTGDGERDTERHWLSKIVCKPKSPIIRKKYIPQKSVNKVKSSMQMNSGCNSNWEPVEKNKYVLGSQIFKTSNAVMVRYKREKWNI